MSRPAPYCGWYIPICPIGICCIWGIWGICPIGICCIWGICPICIWGICCIWGCGTTGLAGVFTGAATRIPPVRDTVPVADGLTPSPTTFATRSPVGAAGALALITMGALHFGQFITGTGFGKLITAPHWGQLYWTAIVVSPLFFF